MANRFCQLNSAIGALAVAALVAHPILAQAVCSYPSPNKVYDASGYIYQGVSKLCGTDVYDLTTGANASRPGQVTVLNLGRFSNHLAGALLRAYPNIAYPVHVAVPDIADGTFVSYNLAAPRVALADVRNFLPFVPTRIVELEGGDGKPLFGYTGLYALPGFERQMLPLNNRSLVFAVSGIGFSDFDGLHRLLSVLEARQWIEVLYINEDDPQRILRAVVPLLTRDVAGAAWKQTVTSHPMRRVSSDQTVAAWLMLGAMLTAVAAFNESQMGQDYAARRRECLAQPGVFNIC